MKRISRAAAILCGLVAGVCLMSAPSFGQGMISAPSQAEDVAETELAGLAQIKPQEVATIQRMLQRLGHLGKDNMSRVMDAETSSAILNHMREAKLPAAGLTPDRLIRSLFLTVWVKEGWGTGQADGQDIVVDPAEVRAAQDALKKLNGAPGPVDGVFGPATLSAIEVFQEDNGLKVTGLLTRNTFHNITRAVKFAESPPAATIHVLNWPDYINPDVLDLFERETNIRVVHEVFDDSAETKELLLAGSEQYDVIVQPGAQMRQVLAKEGAVLPLDFAKLPNAKGIDPAVLEYTARLDPGNRHSVPYMWGTVGLGINKDKVRAIRPDAPVNSMAILLDPQYAADLAKCGIGMIDEPVDVMPAIVSYVGGDYEKLGITDLEAVDQALSRVAQYVKAVSIDTYIDGITNGKYCAVLGYSGDVLFARDPAKEKGVGTVVYTVPKEGSEIWFDLIVIPAKARNPDAAYRFIDYLMSPKAAAENTNYLQYANAITTSAPLIDPKLLEDPGLYPPKETLKRMAVQPPLTVEVEAEIKRIWEKLPKE